MYLRIVSFVGLAALAGAGWAAPSDTSESSSPAQDRAATASSREARVQEPMIPPTSSSPSSEQQQQARLVATDELIGRDVVTREGERVGTLEYITLDLDQGNVSHLVLNTSGSDYPSGTTTSSQSETGATSQDHRPGTTTSDPSTSDTTTSSATASTPPGTTSSSQSSRSTASSEATGASQDTGDQGGDLLVIPWSIVNVDESESITISATRHHIASAPRLSREELNQLAEPSMAAYVVDYWAPASEMAALEGRRQQEQSQSEPATSQPSEAEPEERQQPEMRDPMRSQEQDRSLDQSRLTDQERSRSNTTSRPGSTTTPSGEPELDPVAGTSSPEQRATGSTAQTSPQATATQPQGATSTSANETEGQMVLVGQEVVTAVTPPMFQLSQDLQGAKVLGRDGEELGQVNKIMIDADTGDAAFAVLEGTEQGRAAIPLQSLRWTAQGTTLLDADSSALQSDEAIIEQPDQVDRAQLAQLYERFDVEPYWQRSDRSGMRSQPTP